MKGWIERVLVGKMIYVVSPAAFKFDELHKFLPAWTERPDLSRSGLFGRSLGRIFCLGGFG